MRKGAKSTFENGNKIINIIKENGKHPMDDFSRATNGDTAKAILITVGSAALGGVALNAHTKSVHEHNQEITMTSSEHLTSAALNKVETEHELRALDASEDCKIKKSPAYFEAVTNDEKAGVILSARQHEYENRDLRRTFTEGLCDILSSLNVNPRDKS